jgi:hypothetical protein
MLTGTVRVLQAAGVRYALIGGVAVGMHAEVPSATLDVNFAVNFAVSFGTRTRQIAAAALEGAGFRKTGEFEHSINFRHPGESRCSLLSTRISTR